VIGGVLSGLQQLPKEQLVSARQERLAGYGRYADE
jgi:hypothetical protein